MTADYNKAVIESLNTLHDYELNSIPIDLDIILDALKRTVRLCSYSRFASKHGLSIPEICEYFESDLGACAYERNRERYIIYYNDTMHNHGLDRFTIAHELGHILLEHHHDAKTDIMLRNNISAKKYKKYENEANCFARNLLSPVPLINRVTNIIDIHSVDDIMAAFDISFTAAKARRDFYKIDSCSMRPTYYKYFENYHISYGYYCDNCNNAEIDASGYCKICGQKAILFEKTCNRIFYDGIKVNEDKRVLVCPMCGNEIFSESAEFCKICGTPLFNVCDGEPEYDDYGNIMDTHFHNNPGNARYC